MAYYNHFRKKKHKQIPFCELKINQMFRNDFYAGKRLRKDIVCVKTGENTYIEKRSKKEHHVRSGNDIYVSSYDVLS